MKERNIPLQVFGLKCLNVSRHRVCGVREARVCSLEGERVLCSLQTRDAAVLDISLWRLPRADTSMPCSPSLPSTLPRLLASPSFH